MSWIFATHPQVTFEFVNRGPISFIHSNLATCSEHFILCTTRPPLCRLLTFLAMTLLAVSATPAASCDGALYALKTAASTAKHHPSVSLLVSRLVQQTHQLFQCLGRSCSKFERVLISFIDRTTILWRWWRFVAPLSPVPCPKYSSDFPLITASSSGSDASTSAFPHRRVKPANDPHQTPKLPANLYRIRDGQGFFCAGAKGLNILIGTSLKVDGGCMLSGTGAFRLAVRQ